MRKALFILFVVTGLYYTNSYARERHIDPQENECCENHGCRKHSHHKPRYIISNNKVFFEGYEVEGASSINFTILKDGYAKDPWNVYYNGVKIPDASSLNFKVLKDGYSQDPWTVYFEGKKIEGASPLNFKVLRDGYAKDAWNTYYYGKKINTAP